jgi:hypothetical protein
MHGFHETYFKLTGMGQVWLNHATIGATVADSRLLCTLTVKFRTEPTRAKAPFQAHRPVPSAKWGKWGLYETQNRA